MKHAAPTGRHYVSILSARLGCQHGKHPVLRHSGTARGAREGHRLRKLVCMTDSEHVDGEVGLLRVSHAIL